MKKLIYLLTVLLLFNCNSENAGDCFQTEGNTIQEEFVVDSFDTLLVNRDVEVKIIEAEEYKVVVETGSNLLNDIVVEVVDGELQLSDNNNCNYLRDYGSTKMFVYTPSLSKVRSSTQYDISSQGELSFDDLELISENHNNPNSFTVGDFRLTVNTQILRIVSNNISSFFLNGNTNNLHVSFYAGVGRFEAENLVANNVNVYHRGANDIVVNPIVSLTGELRGTGDLIIVNQPETLNVEQYYTGQLISN